MYTPQILPHHLQYVATIPCEIRKSKNGPRCTLSEHFSLAKKFVFLLYMEFETEQLKLERY